ncbi:MAG TPA: flagellar export chaperone FliS [Acidobacteriota bacterium]|nr:flagellar export chaperone FliS [Acidobacteriota bacterium]
MAANQPLAHRYREVAVKTANPLQLVVILYDAAINALQQAQGHIRSKDIARRAGSLNHSVAIISELQACLNFQEGGQIAHSLDRLYNYMKHRIFTANIEQRCEPLAEVISLLENLRAAWGELVTQHQNAAVPTAVPGSGKSGGIENGAPGLNSLNISG